MPRLLVLLVLTFAASRVHAEGLSPAAQARLDAGVTQYNAGNYAAAITEYEAAYALQADPQILFAWAQAERLANRCTLAVPRYRRYLASHPSADATALANNGIALCEATGVSSAASNPERPLPWYQDPVGGAVVAGVVGIGVGIGFLIASSGNSDRAGSAQTSAAFNDRIDKATTQRRIGVTVMLLGGGLVGGGLGYHYWTKRKHASATVVSTDGHSLFVAGAW